MEIDHVSNMNNSLRFETKIKYSMPYNDNEELYTPENSEVIIKDPDENEIINDTLSYDSEGKGYYDWQPDVSITGTYNIEIRVWDGSSDDPDRQKKVCLSVSLEEC